MLRVNVNKVSRPVTVNVYVVRVADELRREDGAAVIRQPTAESIERVKYWTRGQAMREERRWKQGITRQPDHTEFAGD